MTDLATIRTALSESLAGIDGLQESPYLLTNPTPPAAEIEPGKIKYDLAMGRGLDEWTMIVRVFVGISTDRGSQATLDRFLAPSGEFSIKAAIEADCSLGGAVDDLRVTDCSGYMIFAREATTAAGRGSTGGPLLGAEWKVSVYAEGN